MEQCRSLSLVIAPGTWLFFTNMTCTYAMYTLLNYSTSRKSKCAPLVTNAVAIDFYPVHLVMARKSLFIETNLRRNSVPYDVCNVMKMVWSDVLSVLTNKNE